MVLYTGEVSIYLSLEQRYGGTGSISASLYSLATRGSNDPDNYPRAPWTQDVVVDELKKYTGRNHHYTSCMFRRRRISGHKQMKYNAGLRELS